MQLRIELTEKDIRALVIKHLQEKLGDIPFDPIFFNLQVKSKQNFKAEWEEAQLRATYERTL